MVVHTHSETDAHRQIEKTIHLKRPHHAGEGAIAVAKIANTFFSDTPQAREPLRKITLSAIARHHSAQTKSFDEKYQLEDAARDALFAALQNAGVAISREKMIELFLYAPATPFEKNILSGSDQNGAWWLAYFLIVRALRMSDGESQEEW
jgi:hypothetical protein